MSTDTHERDLLLQLQSSGRLAGFWRQAFAIQGSITPYVMPNVMLFGLFAALVALLSDSLDRWLNVVLALPVAPYEFVGAALGVLLVLRTNAGYERWWEGRKLWGGIVNQCRNLAISANAYGPSNLEWQQDLARWVAAFPHVARASLRGEDLPDCVVRLVGEKNAQSLSLSEHMPSTVVLHIAKRLRCAVDSGKMDSFAFLQIDKERAALIDHIGACERIKKTPLSMAYSIKIRRFIAIFLLTLPFALVRSVDAWWWVPLISMLVAYPLLSLDQLGMELQNPFDTRNLSHLPLDEISLTIEHNVCALAGASDLTEPLPALV